MKSPAGQREGRAVLESFPHPQNVRNFPGAELTRRRERDLRQLDLLNARHAEDSLVAAILLAARFLHDGHGSAVEVYLLMSHDLQSRKFARQFQLLQLAYREVEDRRR